MFSESNMWNVEVEISLIDFSEFEAAWALVILSDSVEISFYLVLESNNLLALSNANLSMPLNISYLTHGKPHTIPLKLHIKNLFPKQLLGLPRVILLLPY